MRLSTLRPRLETQGHRLAPKAEGWSHTLSTTERGYGGKWPRIRQRVLERDKHLCIPCQDQGILTIARQVDHIVNKASGGTDDLSNLQSICIDCHKAKTAKEGGVAKGQSVF